MPRLLIGVTAMRSKDNGSNHDSPSAAHHNGARIVELCAQQLQAAIDEAGQEVALLVESVVGTVSQSSAVSSDNAASAESLNSVLMRLQFADRLKQRLTNVGENLGYLAEHMRVCATPLAGSDWLKLLEQARASFTTEQERLMFDAAFAELQIARGAQLPHDNASVQPQVTTLFKKDDRND